MEYVLVIFSAPTGALDIMMCDYIVGIYQGVNRIDSTPILYNYKDFGQPIFSFGVKLWVNLGGIQF